MLHGTQHVRVPHCVLLCAVVQNIVDTLLDYGVESDSILGIR